MVFLKLVRTEFQVNYKTQPFWVKMVHLVSNFQTLAGHAVGTIHSTPTTTLHFDTTQIKNSFPHWIFLLFAKIRLEITNVLCGVNGNLSEQE